MKPNLHYHTQLQKLLQSTEEVEVEDLEVPEEVEETVEEVEARLQLHQATGGPSIQIFLQESGQGAACISNGANQLIFVVNQQPVLGRIFLHQSQRRRIENLTSPANH